MADYDISKAFKVIEDDLIGSMIKNLDHHRAMETDEGIQWTQWQVQQLKMLERYKQTNAKKFGKQFNSINNQIANVLTQMQEKGGFDQEQYILKAIQNGFKGYKHLADGSIQGEFFGINDNKLQALINATTNDMQKAETAVLRLADDQYRKAIFNAQIYAQTGGTYAKAVDMATKDMLRAGLNCVEYKNGARHTLSSYAEMALRTAGTRAYLQGEGEKRKEWGIHTVILNQRTCPCPLCFPFVGKVFVDDVWSGGTPEEAQELGYPLLSEAIAEGLYHPNCKDIHTTYFEGITGKNKPTASEKQKAIEEHSQQQKANYSQNQAYKYRRMSTYSLDEDNKRIYKARATEWEEKANGFKIYYVAKSIANSGSSDIIKFKDNSSIYKPVTNESINKIPKLNIFSDDTLNSLHQQASKDLLNEVSKCEPIGTELSIVYDRNMKPIKGCGYVVGDVGRVRIDNPSVPYHAFHNHGSGETFSVEDLLGITKRDNMISLSTVGNNGKIYCIKKTPNSDCTRYNEFLRSAILDKSFFDNVSYYDLKKGNVDLSQYSKKDINNLKKKIVEFGRKCAENGKRFGFEYIEL